MGNELAASGWKISQVVSLLDMPRRDITRSCYSDRKRGGAGILQTADGSWGRRSYNIEDMAWIYLVKLQHDEGFSLPEIARRMDTSAGVDELCEHLGDVAARAEEALDELRVKRERARVFKCALAAGAEGASGAVERYLQDRIGDEAVETLRLVLSCIMHPSAGAAAMVPLGVRDCVRIRQVLEEPGMDLAIEFWAGPGAFERLLEAQASW